MKQLILYYYKDIKGITYVSDALWNKEMKWKYGMEHIKTEVFNI